MFNPSRALVAGIALVAVLAACGQSDEEFLDCRGKCDSVGPLAVSSTWVPEGGFVRAVVKGGGALSVDPPESATVEARGDDRYIVSIAAPGFYTISAKGAELPIRVSNDGPELTLDGAGEHVALGSSTRVQLQGSAIDPLGEPLSLAIAGEPVALDAAGRYADVVRPARFGVNTFELVATDRAGNQFRATRAILAAPEFSDRSQVAVVGLSDAGLDILAAELSEELPSLLDIPVPSEPVFSTLGQDVILQAIDLSDRVTLTMKSESGRMKVTVRLAGESRVDGVIDGLVSSSDFVARIQDLEITADVSFAADGHGGIEVRTNEVTATSSDSSVEVTSLIPDFIFEWLVGSLDDYAADSVEDNFGPWLTEVLRRADGDTRIDAPGEDLELRLRLGALVNTAGQLRAVIDAVIDPAASPALSGPGPAIRRPEAVSVPRQNDIGITLSYDLVNQYLYRLWERGEFRWSWDERDLAGAIADVPALAGLDPIVDISAELALPPVADDGGDRVELSVGELRVTARIDTSLFQITATSTVHARAGIAVEVVDGALVLVPELSEIHVDADRQAFAGLDPEALERLLESLAPRALEQVAGDIERFPLPSFDLEDLALDGRRLGLAESSAAVLSGGLSLGGDMAIIEP